MTLVEIQGRHSLLTRQPICL